MKKSPLVSVVMPAYNHGRYIARGIESVLSQTYENVELIVIDDGSKDDTWAVIESVRARSSRPFVAVTQANQGVCKTLNRGIAMSSGELVAAVASDDYFLPDKLRRQVEVFASSDDSVALVHTSAFLDYQNGAPLEDISGSYLPAVGRCFDDVLTQRVRVVAPSMMFRRSAHDAIGGFDETLAAEDVDFFVRLAAADYGFAYLPEPLMVKTVVEGSGGSQLRRLIAVHERILEKQAHRLTSERREALRALMYRHLIRLALGGGDYGLA